MMRCALSGGSRDAAHHDLPRRLCITHPSSVANDFTTLVCRDVDSNGKGVACNFSEMAAIMMEAALTGTRVNQQDYTPTNVFDIFTATDVLIIVDGVSSIEQNGSVASHVFSGGMEHLYQRALDFDPFSEFAPVLQQFADRCIAWSAVTADYYNANRASFYSEMLRYNFGVDTGGPVPTSLPDYEPSLTLDRQNAPTRAAAFGMGIRNTGPAQPSGKVLVRACLDTSEDNCRTGAVPIKVLKEVSYSNKAIDNVKALTRVGLPSKVPAGWHDVTVCVNAQPRKSATLPVAESRSDNNCTTAPTRILGAGEPVTQSDLLTFKLFGTRSVTPWSATVNKTPMSGVTVTIPYVLSNKLGTVKNPTLEVYYAQYCKDCGNGSVQLKKKGALVGALKLLTFPAYGALRKSQFVVNIPNDYFSQTGGTYDPLKAWICVSGDQTANPDGSALSTPKHFTICDSDRWGTL
jgi:hypothetical protein